MIRRSTSMHERQSIMYKKLRAWMEPRYTKIAIYTIVSSIIIFICCLILINSNAALSRFWGLALAILQPLVLGLVIAYLLLPLVRKLETKVFGGFKSKQVRRNLAVLLIYLIIAAALAAGLTVLIISITKTVASIRLADLQSLAAYLQNEFADFWKVIEQKLAEYDVNLGTVGKKAAGMFTNAKSAGSTILFAMIFSIYFLLDSGINKYWTKVSHVLLKDDTRAKAKEFLRDADRVFSGYIRGQALDALIMGTMVTIAFLIAGIPYAAVIGIMTGIGNLIPFVGPIVGFASLIIACLTTRAFMKLIIGAVILIIVLAVDGNLINPKLLSTSVKVHPILVFLALIAGGAVGGLVGMLVAVPCAALIKLQFDKYVKRRAEEAGIALPEAPGSVADDAQEDDVSVIEDVLGWEENEIEAATEDAAEPTEVSNEDH